MTNKELILDFLTHVKTDLIEDLHSKKLSDGDLGLKTEVGSEGGQLLGADYYYFLVHGRKPGKQPPPETIMNWIDKKGIKSDGISLDSLAFLIGRKIGRQGTDIYLGIRPGLALEQIIKHNGEQFAGDLRDKYRNEFTELFGKELKKIFA